MNLFQLATRGIDLNSLPDESAPERDLLAFEPTKPGSRLAVPQELDAAFEAAGDEYGVDPDVLRAMAFAESRFRSDVISGQVKSRTGATGLMQFMPGTAERFGINPLDPVESIFGAAAYMRANLEKFDGDYGKAVAAYNWGENRKAYDADDWKDRLPAETRGYLDTVFGAADELKLRAPAQPESKTEAAPKNAPQTAPETAKEPAPIPERTWGEAFGDTTKSLAQGLLDVGSLPGVAYSAVTGDWDTGYLKAIRGTQEVLQDQKSAAIQARNKELQSKLGTAEGWREKLAVGGIETLKDPTLLFDTLARSAPGMFAGGGVGRGVGAAANAAGNAAFAKALGTGSELAARIAVTAKNGAGVLARATATGTAAGIQGASVASDTYDELSKLPVEAFKSEPEWNALEKQHGAQQAKEILAGAAANRALLMATGASVLSMKLVPGGDAIEKMFLPKALKGEAAKAAVASTSLLTRPMGKGMDGGLVSKAVELIVKGSQAGALESVSEGVEEGTGAIAKGLELSRAGQRVNLSEMAGEAYGQGAAAGLVMGKVAGMQGAYGSRTPRVEDMPTTPQAPVIAPTVAPAPSNPAGQDVAAEIMRAESGLAAELAALKARSAPAPDFTQRSTTPQAQPGSVPVTGGLAAELQALRARSSSPQEVANVPQGTVPQAQPTPQGASAQAADVARADAPVPAADIPTATDVSATTQAPGLMAGDSTNAATPANDGTQSTTATGTQGQATGSRVILQNRDRSTPSSIAQMRSIAARPDYGRLGFSRDFANGAPVVAGGTIQPAQMGRKDVATASDGRRIPVQYAVVDAGSVLASNTVDGSSNTDYGNGAVQAVRAIAGNGRIAGLQAAYQSGNANAYRQELVQDAALHGIAPEVIAPMANPVLVRVMPDSEVTADIGDISNTVGNLDLSAVEQANNDANRVQLDALQFADDGSITTDAVRQFVRAMPQSEQGQLLDTNGQPTRQAVDRLSAAVFAKAYGNDDLVRLFAQAQDPEARNVLSALAQVAPKMARLEGAGALDVRDVVAQAAEIAVNARRQGVPLAKAAQQMDMAADPDVGVVLDLFASNARTVRPVVEALGRMADMAYTEASKPAEDMFGAVPRASRADIINQLRPENERGSQEALEDAAGREPVAVDAVGQANEPARPAALAEAQAGRSAEDGATLNGQVSEQGAEYSVRQQFSLFGQEQGDQLQLFLDNGPVPSQAGARAIEAQREAVAAIADMESVASILAKSLSRDFAARQKVRLVGHTVSSAADLALLAQVYRDPRFETFRLVFTDNSGRVVSQLGITSRLPASATVIVGDDMAAYLREVSNAAKKTGATSYYMLHNHPSGQATPSGADLQLTKTFARWLPGMTLRSHVVIDTNQYSVIDANGKPQFFQQDFAQPPQVLTGPLAGEVIASPSDVVRMAQSLQADAGAITLIATDAQFKVKAVSSIPAATLSGSKGLVRLKIARALMRLHSANVFAVGRDVAKLRKLGGIVVDALHVKDDGSVDSLASAGVIASKNLGAFPEDRRARVTPDTTENFAYLRFDPSAMQSAGQKMLVREQQDSLTSYTPEEVTRRQEEAAQAEAKENRADDAAARAEAAARQAKEIAQRSAAAADTFELGQYGEDNLSGQGGLKFSRGKNASVTTDRDVVGNQSGIPANDATTGAVDENTGIPLNADGSVTIYHHTSAAAAAAIRRTGTLKSQAEPDVYVTTHRETDTGYGDTAVAIRIDPARLQIDDEFPNGRKDFRLNVGRPGGSIRVELENEQSAPASQGAIKRSFAGARAATADTHALVTAQDRLDAGEDPETVRQETGWHRGTDGRMRFEISDADALLKADTSGAEGSRTIGQMFPLGYYGDEVGLTVGRMLHHPALFAAYPAIADIKVKMVYDLRGDDVKGSFNPSTNTITLNQNASWRDAMSTLLHEIQHGIQNIEGFAMGDSPERLAKTMPDVQAINDAKLLARFMERGESAFDARQRFTRYMGRDPNPQGVYLAERNEPNEIARMASTPLDAYKRNAGEVEARNTQARQKLTADQRRATSPSQTADVADADVIVVFNGKEMANAPMPANAAPDASATVQPLRTQAATIRSAITKAYGKLLGQLESKGLVTLTQTQEQAIEAAAQARADKTGQPLAEVRASLMGSVSNSVATDTPAFKRWFGDSKVVDADGKPLVVYHGTASDIAVFDPEKTEALPGIFMTPIPSTAGAYASAKRGSANVMPLYVSLKNPVELTAAQYTKERLDAAYSGDADGIIVRNWETGAIETVIAFNPQDIKSAIGNNGNFDPNDLDIRRSANGSIQGFFDPQTGQSFLIADNLTAEAAPGVLMHEVGIHMAADGSMKALFNRAAMMLKLQRGNPFIKAVQARMDAAGETSGEEAAAYIAEAYENDRASAPPSVSKWVQDFTAAVRAWLFNKGIMGADRLTVADIAAVARANARSMARDGGATGGQGFGPAFSRAPVADQTQTEAFKRWFGDSKVVDADGNPLRVYHGTTADITAFEGNRPTEKDAGWYGEGIYFTADPTTASAYSRYEEMQGKEARIGANVLPVFVSLQNPYVWPKGRAAATSPAEAKAIRAELERAGYDGVIVPNEYADEAYASHYEVIAFRPEQVKSATGNNGNFDPADPDIRFSRAAPTATPPIPTSAQDNLFTPSQSWELPEATFTDRLIYELQDGRVDLKRVQEAIAATGKQIGEGFDARLAETLMPGRIARRTESFLSVEVKPLLESMARNNVSQDELSDYLLARHAPERNAQIAKVNPDMPDGGAGTNSQGVLMTTQAARDHIAALTAGKRTVMELLARQVDALTLGTREILVREGLEKQETVDAWAGAYQHYVPLFKDEAMETPGHPIGAGMSVTGTASKRATGSRGEVTNMVAHILMQREAAITRAEKNRVAMALYGLALTNPNAEMWTTIRPSMPSDQIANELVRMGVDPMEAEVGMQGVPTIRSVDSVSGKVVDRPNPMYKRLDNALVIKVNGEDRVILFNASNKRAARLVQNLKNQDGVLGQLDIAGSIVGKATRYFAAINTQYNPAFGMVNVIRDVGGALVNLTDTQLAGQQARVLSDSIPAMIGIARDLRGDAQRTPWSDLWQQFQDDGGRTGYRDLFIDPYKRADAVQKELETLGKDGKLTPGAAAHAVLDLLDDFNTTLENGVRLAAYKAALDKGLSRAESARLARELTLDFNRKGRAGRELGPLYAFFNASVQGTARTLKALQGPAGKRILAGGLALGVMQALMLAAAGFDDDEIPEFVKARAFIIPLPGKQYIAIPLQFGLNALPNTGRVVTELLMSGGKDWGEKSFNALGELLGSFNPLGGGNIFTSAGALKTIAPTVIDPIVDMATNTDFTGKPIGKERMPWDTRPGFAMARESTKRSATGQVYIGISKAINTMTGGNDFAQGLASPSPEEVRYVFTTVGGGVFRELEKALNASVLTAQGESLKAREVPFGSRFAGEVDDQDLQRSRYFKNTARLEKLEAQLKGFSKEGRGEEVRALVKDNPEIRLYELSNQVQSEITKLNKLAGEHINDRETLKRIDAARTTYMRALNDKVREMEREANASE